jgi:hypothetical protein
MLLTTAINSADTALHRPEKYFVFTFLNKHHVQENT